MQDRCVFLLISVLSFGGCGTPVNENPLPSPNEIATMQAIDLYIAGEERGAFVIPPEHWEPILDALIPARRDRQPAKWLVLGRLTIEDKTGRSFHVSLYDLQSETPGAFAAGPTFEDRVYYRGGDSKRLRHALHEAYEATEQR